MKKLNYLLPILGFTLLVSSCSDVDQKTQEDQKVASTLATATPLKFAADVPDFIKTPDLVSTVGCLNLAWLVRTPSKENWFLNSIY